MAKTAAKRTATATTTHAARASATAEKQRRIQQRAGAIEAAAKAAKAKQGKKKSADDEKKPVQAGSRKQPQNPMPAQHLRKPGNEADLVLQPRFLAPDYQGSEKLIDKVAIITGGDSGIGRAVAVLFAREGADVAIVYLDEDTDAKATKKHVEAEGRRCVLIPGDVKDAAFCKDAVAKTVKSLGRLDILVNNAAFQQHIDKLEDLDDEHLQETLQTNIAGYFHMARAALPHLSRGSAIINTGSETGIFGSKALLDYSATKGAIHAFTMALASNLLERGIRVNCVAPGPVWTPLNPADRSAEEVAEFGADSDMGRPAQPEEISPAFVFLAAPSCSSYISGAILPVMGGPRG